MPVDTSAPQLQLAIDHSLTQGQSLLTNVHAEVDIIEVGTRLIIEQGMLAVKTLKADYPSHQILADVKIMDAGKGSADIVFSAGADIVTVLGCASDATITGVVESAKTHNRKVMADLIQVADLETRAAQLLALGVDYLCVHTAFDLQDATCSPIKSLATLRAAFPSAKLAIAGGLGLTEIDAVLPLRPNIVIVGGAICKAENAAKVAAEIKTKLRR